MNGMKHEPKTLQDIKVALDTVKEAKKAKKDKGIKQCLEEAYEEVKKDLLAYYNTTEGRLEIDMSPNSHLSTIAAVDMLIGDKDTWVKKGLKNE